MDGNTVRMKKELMINYYRWKSTWNKCLLVWFVQILLYPMRKRDNESGVFTSIHDKRRLHNFLHFLDFENISKTMKSADRQHNNVLLWRWLVQPILSLSTFVLCFTASPMWFFIFFFHVGTSSILVFVLHSNYITKPSGSTMHLKSRNEHWEQ